MSAENLPPNGIPNPFTTDEASLQDLLLEQAGAIGELSRESDEYAMKALRFDEGTCALQWTFARVEAHGEVVAASCVNRCLAELVAFAETGRETGWLKAAREEMGR